MSGASTRMVGWVWAPFGRICGSLSSCSGSKNMTFSLSPSLLVTTIPLPLIGRGAYTYGVRLTSLYPLFTRAGWGKHGQLGNESDQTEWYPRQLIVPEDPGIRFKLVSCGGFHTLALTTDNQLYAWGNGSFGQLGVELNPPEEGSTFPRRVTTLAGRHLHSTVLSVDSTNSSP